MGPDLDRTIRAGCCHLRGFGATGWCSVQVITLSRALGGGFCCETENGPRDKPSFRRNSNAQVEEVPSPDCAIFISADDASSIKAETRPASVRVDVTSEAM